MRFGGVLQGDLNVLIDQLREIGKQVFVCPTFRQQSYEEFDRERVPLLSGLPTKIAGSMTIRSCQFIASPVNGRVKKGRSRTRRERAWFGSLATHPIASPFAPTIVPDIAPQSRPSPPPRTTPDTEFLRDAVTGLTKTPKSLLCGDKDIVHPLWRSRQIPFID